ncbi:hypothetical protein EV682_12817 [Iodobacter fluviatilis]|uniref:Uncharacterized protein n=1 Tax=Iodobacter fluviatilis TaxID=537 RepID=A0A377Q5C0_9NEIS|nr:hypothetical protein EV682_12817 [Iodobacter fluviatilis]STQ90133.1 Uncharacterised protein [Iodobacter fluviatilis]
MHEMSVELKALRLHGMAAAWLDLKSQGCQSASKSFHLSASKCFQFVSPFFVPFCAV